MLFRESVGFRRPLLKVCGIFLKWLTWIAWILNVDLYYCAVYLELSVSILDYLGIREFLVLKQCATKKALLMSSCANGTSDKPARARSQTGRTRRTLDWVACIHCEQLGVERAPSLFSQSLMISSCHDPITINSCFPQRMNSQRLALISLFFSLFHSLFH